MEGEVKCEALDVPAGPNFGPGSHESLVDAAKIINSAQRPVLSLGLLASRPENADAVRALLRKTGLPVVATFHAAGTASADLFKRFAGRIGQLDNTPGDEPRATIPLSTTRPYGIILDARESSISIPQVRMSIISTPLPSNFWETLQPV
jgi:acetolactate synthase-1/2/3 large subunit